jgi:hypothetical protein
MVKTNNNVSIATKKAANTLLSLQKLANPPKFLSLSDATLTLLLHRRFNINDDDDECDYEVKVLCTFNVKKTRMSLVHFVGFSSDYDRIIPRSSLRNYIK